MLGVSLGLEELGVLLEVLLEVELADALGVLLELEEELEVILELGDTVLLGDPLPL